MGGMETPTFEGILDAADRLTHALPTTPSWSYPLLDARAGRRVVVKHENVQPTGAFKVRGGLTLLATLPREARRAGLVTVSTGNHAQSIAFAARASGVAATIVMPADAPAFKAAAVEGLGATVVLHGCCMNEAAAHAREIAAREGRYFVDPGNEAAIVHGHGTVYLELLRQHPEIDTVYVPIGSGSGAAGAVLVRDALTPGTRIVGVQAAGAPAAHRSWTSGRIETAGADTFAAGLATGTGFETAQRILRGGLDDFLLVTDEQLREAVHAMAVDAHTLCEGAGAAGLAGILAEPDRDGVSAFACTGGNAGPSELSGLTRVALAA